MKLGATLADIGSVAVKLEPEIFDLSVTEGFENAAVEFVACGV